MPCGDKSKCTDKQKRQAEHIAEGYAGQGVSKKTANKRAWATVNKQDGGGKLSGSGRGKTNETVPSKKGDRQGADATANKSAKKKSVKKKPTSRKSAKNAPKKKSTKKRP